MGTEVCLNCAAGTEACGLMWYRRGDCVVVSCV